MRGVFIYILLVLQVTLPAQSVHFNFENYQITKIGSSESITFKSSYFDEYLYGYQQLNLKMKLDSTVARDSFILVSAMILSCFGMMKLTPLHLVTIWEAVFQFILVNSTLFSILFLLQMSETNKTRFYSLIGKLARR